MLLIELLHGHTIWMSQRIEGEGGWLHCRYSFVRIECTRSTPPPPPLVLRWWAINFYNSWWMIVECHPIRINSNAGHCPPIFIVLRLCIPIKRWPSPHRRRRHSIEIFNNTPPQNSKQRDFLSQWSPSNFNNWTGGAVLLNRLFTTIDATRGLYICKGHASTYNFKDAFVLMPWNRSPPPTLCLSSSGLLHVVVAHTSTVII